MTAIWVNHLQMKQIGDDKMDSEDAVQRDFIHGGLSCTGAVNRLEGLGIAPKEAERMVGEWADSQETMGRYDEAD